MILDGIKRFAAKQRKNKDDVYKLPVTGIVAWLDVGNGYTSVHFDVRSPFENDGSYTHQEFASLARDNWRQFVELHCDGKTVTLTGLDGKKVKITPKRDFDLDNAFGTMILDLLKSLRTEKAFAPLLLAPRGTSHRCRRWSVQLAGTIRGSWEGQPDLAIAPLGLGLFFCREYNWLRRSRPMVKSAIAFVVLLLVSVQSLAGPTIGTMSGEVRTRPISASTSLARSTPSSV